MKKFDRFEESDGINLFFIYVFQDLSGVCLKKKAVCALLMKQEYVSYWQPTFSIHKN